jgi:hypothetical protein
MAHYSPMYISSRLTALSLNSSTEGISIFQSRDIIDSMIIASGYNNTTHTVNIAPTMSQMQSIVNSGGTFLFSCSLHSVYGNHTMFAFGYDIYLKETKFLFYTIKTYKNFC